MADKFIGEWKLVSSDNFDEYMKEIGVGLVTRKAATVLKPVLKFEVSDDGKHWKFTSTSTFKTHTTEFDLDNEFDEETIDGRKMKSTFSFDGQKLIQHQKKIKDDDKESYLERYVDSDGNLVIMCQSGEVKCVRKYEKQT